MVTNDCKVPRLILFVLLNTPFPLRSCASQCRGAPHPFCLAYPLPYLTSSRQAGCPYDWMPWRLESHCQYHSIPFTSIHDHSRVLVCLPNKSKRILGAHQPNRPYLPTTARRFANLLIKFRVPKNWFKALRRSLSLSCVHSGICLYYFYNYFYSHFNSHFYNHLLPPVLRALH